MPLFEGGGGQVDGAEGWLDGAAVRVEINLSSDDSIAERVDAARAGMDAWRFAADPEVHTGFAAGAVGRQHRFGGLGIGAFTMAGPRIDVQDRLNDACSAWTSSRTSGRCSTSPDTGWRSRRRRRPG